MKAPKLEIEVVRREERGRTKKKFFYKYEILPRPALDGFSFLFYQGMKTFERLPIFMINIMVHSTSCPNTFQIVAGCMGIIKSSQQLTLNHSVFRPARQQSTVNSQQ
ncbi:hypothetical protein [Microcoleus vaginatus]|uniref:hypothetical protein n=1 Tax=Microcoleus vaginatus TaxID=119532 RepID=UPI001F611C90|nr:hypothetical protein D0A37_04880 [Microcoleus vaginatus HSN003]